MRQRPHRVGIQSLAPLGNRRSQPRLMLMIPPLIFQRIESTTLSHTTNETVFDGRLLDHSLCQRLLPADPFPDHPFSTPIHRSRTPPG